MLSDVLGRFRTRSLVARVVPSDRRDVVSGKWPPAARPTYAPGYLGVQIEIGLLWDSPLDNRGLILDVFLRGRREDGMNGEPGMAISSDLHDRVKHVAAELRRDLRGEKGCPEWGTKFTRSGGKCCELADALVRKLMGQGLEGQAAEEGPAERGVCGRHAVEDDLERRIVADAVRYRSNQQSRMHYD